LQIGTWWSEAGAAGCWRHTRAASAVASAAHRNEKRPGVKILISGGTRCNRTTTDDARGFRASARRANFCTRPWRRSVPRVVELVEAEGVLTRPNRPKDFPQRQSGTTCWRHCPGDSRCSGCAWPQGGVQTVDREAGPFAMKRNAVPAPAERGLRPAEFVPRVGETEDGYRGEATFGPACRHDGPGPIPDKCRLGARPQRDTFRMSA